MAIGTLTAIGLGLGAVGSIVGSSSANKAADKAADVSLQVADKNNALAREIYGKNEGYLSPYMSRGNVAGDAINALLGLPSAPAMQSAPQAQPGATPPGSPPLNNSPWAQLGRGIATNALSAGGQFGGFTPGSVGPGAAFQAMSGQQPVAQPQAPGMVTTAAPAATQAAPVNYQSAFDNYKNSTGYQFRFDQGMNALNSGWAGNGVLKSGAAAKSALEYGQGIASAEFNNYLGALGNQQGVGLQGASALAGVGQNYVNTISANNNSAGTAQANAALSKGANNPFANALGMVGGGLFGMGK